MKWTHLARLSLCLRRTSFTTFPWHACHIPTQWQMGPAFYVLIKEEFVPSQTCHPWPLRLFTLIIHPQWGECCQGWADRGEEGETEAGERERSLSSSRHPKVLLTSACPPTRPSPCRTVVRVITCQNHIERHMRVSGWGALVIGRKKGSARKKNNSKSHFKDDIH